MDVKIVPKERKFLFKKNERQILSDEEATSHIVADIFIDDTSFNDVQRKHLFARILNVIEISISQLLAITNLLQSNFILKVELLEKKRKELSLFF